MPPLDSSKDCIWEFQIIFSMFNRQWLSYNLGGTGMLFSNNIWQYNLWEDHSVLLHVSQFTEFKHLGVFKPGIHV